MATPKSLASGDGGIPANSFSAYIQIEGGDIRWRDDGVNPSNTDGHLLNDGHAFYYDKELLKFRLIEISGSPIAHVTFYPQPVD